MKESRQPAGDRVPILLVRHGRTVLNAEGRLRGHADPELDDVGLAQARATAVYLRPYAPRIVVTSPLLRAQHTGAAIVEATGAQLMSDDAFIDRDYGQWTACVKEDVIRQWGSVDAAPGVEDASEMSRRAWAGLNRYAEKKKPIAIVTHDAVIRALLTVIEPDIDPVVETASWAVLYRDDKGWHIESFDNVAAAPPEAGHGEDSPVLMRCSVAVVRRNEILLLHRTDRDDWVLPGGAPRRSESMVACARREVREETGLSVDPQRCAFVLEVTDPQQDRRLVELVFISRVTSRGDLTAERPTSVPVWVPASELSGIRLRPPINGYLPALVSGTRDSAAYLGNMWRPEVWGDWR